MTDQKKTPDEKTITKYQALELIMEILDKLPFEERERVIAAVKVFYGIED